MLDGECKACWPNYPKPCTEKDCKGLVHAEFGDESYDPESGEENYWLETKCDTCGEPEW